MKVKRCYKRVILRQTVIAVALFFVFCVYDHDVSAVEYDAHVHEDRDEDDLEKDEYNSIKDAIEDGARDILVYSGEYSEDLEIEKKVKIVGKNKKDVVISGAIEMKDASELEKLTVTGRGIQVVDGADVTLHNVIIRDTRKNSIETTGRGTLRITNSSIYNSNKKGMYIQWGKDVYIKDSKVYKNSEEGIDIRANVDGSIVGCDIYDNGESGIEVILGDSELSVADNLIEDNGSSGIAAQFYTVDQRVGGLVVSRNKIQENENYGIDCKSPSGGNPGSGYWARSISLKSNIYKSNGERDINLKCGIKEVVSQSAVKSEVEENTELMTEPVQAVVQKKESSIEEEAKVRMEEALRLEQEWLRRNISRKANEIRLDLQDVQTQVQEIVYEEDDKNSWEVFFNGHKANNIATLRESEQQTRRQIYLLEDYISQTQEQGSIVELSMLQEDAGLFQGYILDTIERYESEFSLRRWWMGLFRRG